MALVENVKQIATVLAQSIHNVY